MSIRQVPPHARWPSGDSRALATIRFSPEELAARYGLVFERGCDDLDWYQLAAIALPDGAQVWLIRHRGNPAPGTVVDIDAGADFARTKAQLTQALGLTDADFLWVSPVVAAPAGQSPETP